MTKVILITGCSSGIGATMARSFHRRGHRVYATARRPETLADLAAEVAAQDARVHLMSSEMLFHASVAPRLWAGLAPGLREDVRLICYLRRHDQYLEAMYKQLLKNGKIRANPRAFLDRRRGTAAYGPVLDAFADAFGHAATHAPQPIHAAASIADSAEGFPIGIAFASGAEPVFTDTNPPARKTSSRAVRSTMRSQRTGNALARHGSM